MHESDLNRTAGTKLPSNRRLAAFFTSENRLHECYRAHPTETPDQQCSFGTLAALAGHFHASSPGPIQRTFWRRVSGPFVILPGKHRIFMALSGRKYGFGAKLEQSVLPCIKGGHKYQKKASEPKRPANWLPAAHC